VFLAQFLYSQRELCSMVNPSSKG